MGSCRSLNFLTGAAVVPIAFLAHGEARILLIPALAIGVYIAIITSISLQEDRQYDRTVLRVTTVALLLTPLSLAVWTSLMSPWGYGIEAWLNAVVFALCLLPALRLPRPGDVSPNAPHPAAGVVRSALGAIYFFDAGLLWCFGQREAALGLYVLFVLGWILRRWWLKSAASRKSPEQQNSPA
jgi:hypothetical protein